MYRFRVLNLSLCIFILALANRSSFTLADDSSLTLTASYSSFSQTDLNDKPGESFQDWEAWKDRYPQCNEENNPNASPIDIKPENIVKSPHLKPFLVNSRMPVDDCLTLSILYNEGDLEMEAVLDTDGNLISVTINALPACLKQLTHVSGGGDRASSSIRYFKRAVFFFTNTPPEEARSLHRIEGKEFEMEIMMEFVDKNGRDYTQIFSFVETKSAETTSDNPIFTILESALNELKNEIINEATGNTSRALKRQTLQTACQENERKYLQSYNDTKTIFASGSVQKMKTLVAKIKGITNADLDKLNENKEQARKIVSSLKSKEEKLEELRENKVNLFDMMNGEKDPNAMEELQQLFKKVQTAIKKLEGQIKLGGNYGNEPTLESMKEVLRSYKVGIPGERPFPGMLYDSPDAVHKKLFELKGQVNNFAQSKRLYDKSCEEFSEFKKSPYAFVKISEPFQISWLFPQTGGYYSYEGSNPIPTCEQRDVTIVFSEPLSISTEQLAMFQNLPSLDALRSEGVQIFSSDAPFEDKLKLDKMVPILADTEATRVVKYVSTSPVFLNDDGFHMKSSVNKKTPQGSGSGLVLGIPRIPLYIILFNYLIVHFSLLL